MKEELIRVLNTKLNDINKNISSLVEINNKIDVENEKLSYATRILNGFKDRDEYNILNFAKLSKEDFDKVLDVVDNDALKIFSTNNCNYDGLIYLINGINNGVSLSLTDEQKNGIEYLIRGLTNKEEEYLAAIDGLNLVKSRFLISDLDVLNKEKEAFSGIINKIDEKNYVSETDKVCEAIEFNQLSQQQTVELLTYLLEYNAKVYEERKDKIVYHEEENKIENKVEEKIEEKTEEKEDDRFTFNPVDSVEIPSFEDIKEETIELPNINEQQLTETKDESIQYESPIVEHQEEKNEVENKVEEENKNEVTFETPTFELPSEEKQEEVEAVNIEEPKAENEEESIPEIEQIVFGNTLEPIEVKPSETESLEIQPETNEIQEDKIDEDFQGVVTNNDYDEEDSAEEEKTSSRELQRLFADYDVKDLEITDEMLLGSADNYKKVLDTLKRNNILNKFNNNKELLKEVLLSSGEEEIEEVLRIIKTELSVDDEDYDITLNIVINTLPTVFVKDNGNYDNFVRNVKLFKNIGINLINLFDFSKEVFIVDNGFASNNYNIVKEYNVDIDYKNAKYMLMLNDIAEKMDYYVESSYVDKTKDETFDGIAYINNYAVKLNSVTDETIKRLRFASENSKKVFGSKPNSLTGEITNLKVNVLELDDNYRNSFFNNQFNGLTSEEVREFVKLIRNSTNVGNYADELEDLNEYHQGLRYNFNGVIVSYNKVNRIYNVLRSYGIDKAKALHFAVCYNLIITKDEYDSLRTFIEKLGGAF